MKRLLKSLALAFIGLVLITTVALAAYSATLTVTEDGTASYAMIGCNMTAEIQYMADNNFFGGSEGLDTRVFKVTTPQPHMLAEDRLMFAIPLAKGDIEVLEFTTGSSNLTNFKIIPGYSNNSSVGYISVSDAANLELGDNFTIELSGWIDTDNGTDKNLVEKQHAFRAYVSPTISGNITSDIFVIEWKSPTNFNDGGGNWVNEPNAYDENTGSQTEGFLPVDDWGSYLELTIPAVNCNNIRYWITVEDTNVDKFEVDVWYNADWHNVVSGAPATGSWQEASLGGYYSVTMARVRFHNSFFALARWGRLHELDFINIGYDVSVTATGVSSGEHTIKVDTTAPTLDFVSGDSDYVYVGDYDAFSFTDGAGNDKPFTIIAWVLSDDWTFRSIISKDYGAPNREWNFFTYTNDKLRFQMMNADATQYIRTESNATLTGDNGKWVQLACSYNGSETPAGIELYRNGSPLASADTNSANYIGMANTNGAVEMAGYAVHTSALLDGNIATIKIYSSVLTPTEILADYNGEHSATNLLAWWKIDEGTGNTINDSSTYGHHATNSGATWVDDSPFELIIDGSLEALTYRATVPDNDNDWTLMQNNVMPYADNIAFWVGGTKELWYRPITITADIDGVTANLTDRTNVYNHGVIHWGGNPSNVGVSIGRLVSGYVPPTGGVELGTPDVVPTVTPPAPMYVGANPTLTDDPIYIFVSTLQGLTVLGGIEMPLAIMWWMLLLMIAIIVFALTYKYTHNLFASGSLMAGVFGYAVARYTGIGEVFFPFIGLFFIILAVVAWAIMERRIQL